MRAGNAGDWRPARREEYDHWRAGLQPAPRVKRIRQVGDGIDHQVRAGGARFCPGRRDPQRALLRGRLSKAARAALNL